MYETFYENQNNKAQTLHQALLDTNFTIKFLQDCPLQPAKTGIDIFGKNKVRLQQDNRTYITRIFDHRLQLLNKAMLTNLQQIVDSNKMITYTDANTQPKPISAASYMICKTIETLKHKKINSDSVGMGNTANKKTIQELLTAAIADTLAKIQN